MVNIWILWLRVTAWDTRAKRRRARNFMNINIGLYDLCGWTRILLIARTAWNADAI